MPNNYDFVNTFYIEDLAEVAGHGFRRSGIRTGKERLAREEVRLAQSWALSGHPCRKSKVGSAT
jgi:hypothetical protein